MLPPICKCCDDASVETIITNVIKLEQVGLYKVKFFGIESLTKNLTWQERGIGSEKSAELTRSLNFQSQALQLFLKNLQLDERFHLHFLFLQKQKQ